MMNQAEAFKRIQSLSTCYQADSLAADLYGTEQDFNSEDCRPVFISAWANMKDSIDEGMEEECAMNQMNLLLRNQIGF